MANPAWSDATRDLIHKRLGLPLGIGGLFRALALYLHPQNGKYLVETTDENAAAFLSSWRVTAGKIGLDTSVDGWAFCTLDDEAPGAGQATLNVYNDAGRTVLVATGNAANGGTITLVPQTGFTLAATVVLGAPTADFQFRFQLVVPAIKRADHEFDGTQIDDAQNRDAVKDALESARSLCTQIEQALQTAAADVANSIVRRNLVGISSDSALINPGLRKRAGLVQETPTGLLEDWRQGQADNLSGSGAVKAAGATQSAVVAYGPNWTGRTTAPTLGTRGRPSLLTFTCTKGLTETAPEFRATMKPDDTRLAPSEGNASEVAQFTLSVGSAWKNPAWGIEGFTVDYEPVLANSAGTPLSTVTTDWSITGLKESNSDAGKLWAYHTGTVLQFYKSEAGRDAQDVDELVAQKTISATVTVFTTEDNDSGITIIGKTGATAAAGNKGSVDFNPPSEVQPADYFTLDLNETARAGRWLSRVRDSGIGGAAWEPNVAGSPNLQDGWIQAGLPFAHAGVNGEID